ncbi:MAG TPA: malectin, partial [Flavisolibacter sp.]|nr:malectin [Flavisolibacter sp.]
MLYAVGYVGGKKVAEDLVALNHLPVAPHLKDYISTTRNLTAAQPGYHYLYRVNCGGPEYIDSNGNEWSADRQQGDSSTWGSVSWTNEFKGMAPFFASQRSISDPVRGTKDSRLFQTFRYGRDQLRFNFPVQDGEYLVELYFTEPWWGTGGGLKANGFRLFDVAVNDKTVLHNVDIWKECGRTGALKKTATVKVKGGLLSVSFPRVAAGQAVLSAIAIATKDPKVKTASSTTSLMEMVRAKQSERSSFIQDWLSTGDEVFLNEKTEISSLPSDLYSAQWLKRNRHESQPTELHLNRDADVFVAIDSVAKEKQSSLQNFSNTQNQLALDDGTVYTVFKKRIKGGENFTLIGKS